MPFAKSTVIDDRRVRAAKGTRDEMNAIERLTELLNQKDQEINKLNQTIEGFELAQEREVWDWARHEDFDDDSGLPVPRLEIRCKNLDTWHNWTWTYGIVYKHLLKHCVFVPLGYTKCGGGGRIPVYEGEPTLPFRDGAHIRHDAKELRLAAYSLFEGEYRKIKTKDE